MDVSGPVKPPFAARPLRLEAFRALRIAPDRVGSSGSARAFARSGRGAASRLTAWEARGAVTRDDVPALYLHEYSHSGLVVRGLIGALDVSRRAITPEQRAVLPHEAVYPAQADALAARMEEAELDPAPILLVQRSAPALRTLLTDLRVAQPTVEFLDRGGTAHRQWSIVDPEVHRLIDAQLADTDALIADGHHRYAAYLRLQQRRPGGARDHGLAMLIDHDDTPLFLGAIHRVLRGTGVDDVMRAGTAAGASVVEAERDAALGALGPRSLVVADGRTWAVLRPPSTDAAVVEWLHLELVPLLARGPARVTYHHEAADALAAGTPEHATAVLLPAPTMDQVLTVARSGGLLPEKATSFQPKPPFGIALRSLRDG